MRRFAVMLTFLTRIPIPIRFDVAYEDYVKGVGWTPLIALIIGVPLFFAGMLNVYVHSYILSVFILALYLMLSGALHVDGLADTMDAFGSNRSKERMLEILKDTKMGTFGVLSHSHILPWHGGIAACRSGILPAAVSACGAQRCTALRKDA